MPSPDAYGQHSLQSSLHAGQVCASGWVRLFNLNEWLPAFDPDQIFELPNSPLNCSRSFLICRGAGAPAYCRQAAVVASQRTSNPLPYVRHALCC